MAEPVTIFTLLATHPNTKAMKSGEVSSPVAKFNFADVKVSNTEFKPLVRQNRYDLAELAIVTYLQAREYGLPYILLPATVVGRNQHHTIFYNAERGALTPADLNGKRVGVRAYTQTTGAWVRGFLTEDYGIDIKRIRWVTFEDPHIAQYHDPAIAERAPQGKVIKQMLMDGELDAAILGDVKEEGTLKHLFHDHEAAGRAWANTHGGVPINHLMVIRKSIAEERPDVVREVYRVLKESRATAGSMYESGELDPLRFGIARIQKSLATIIGYGLEQQLIKERVTPEEIFAPAARILGAAA